MVASIKDKMRIPVLFMTYLNPLYVYGYDRFFARCAEIGVSGVIVPDMPYEEQEETREASRKYEIEVVTLIAPTSLKRIAGIAKNAEGFVYLVSSMGVTGVRGEIATDLPEIVAEIRKYTSIPIAIGFGISTPEQARRYSAIADGVIVGSAIVRIIGKSAAGAKDELKEYIKTMKNSVS
jgi:tryptophan synthase alpha chain